jgi:hypothetical protein
MGFLRDAKDAVEDVRASVSLGVVLSVAALIVAAVALITAARR